MFYSKIHGQTILEISQGDLIEVAANSVLIDRQAAVRRLSVLLQEGDGGRRTPAPKPQYCLGQASFADHAAARRGYIVAMTVLAAMSDISRFEIAEQLVGYSGLGAGLHDSDKPHNVNRTAF